MRQAWSLSTRCRPQSHDRVQQRTPGRRHQLQPPRRPKPQRAACVALQLPLALADELSARHCRHHSQHVNGTPLGAVPVDIQDGKVMAPGRGATAQAQITKYGAETHITPGALDRHVGVQVRGAMRSLPVATSVLLDAPDLPFPGCRMVCR
jgi:hypothetical protein